jgi:hypothetical protein
MFFHKENLKQQTNIEGYIWKKKQVKTKILTT